MSVGLRERKKVATREALSRAALELASERGLHGATSEAIAAAADVSTRTFHNYFANKEDAILFGLEKSVNAFVAAFKQRNPAEPVLDSLEAVVIEFVESDTEFDQMIAVTRLMADHPSLIAGHVAVYDSTSDAMVAEIGRRTGMDPNVDLYPRLVFQAANAVTRSAAELHILQNLQAGPTKQSVVSAVRDGFAQLRCGFSKTP